MATPTVDIHQRATYPDLRDVMAAVSVLEESAPLPVRQMGTSVSTEAINCLRDARPVSLTAAELADRIGHTPNNVNNWLKQTGWKLGIIITGTAKRRAGVRAEKLYSYDEGKIVGGGR